VLKRTSDAVVPESAAIAFQAMRRHKKKFGVFPNLVRPKTFNEKVLHRMVFDRRPILPKLQDKYAARAYVRERLGEHVLPRLYWVTKDPANIPFDDLPQRFVLKPTHGSGWYRIVLDKAAVDRQELLERCAFWLSQSYYDVAREWVYKPIEPRILVEEYVNDGSALNPISYKFFVFHGTVQLIEAFVGTHHNANVDFYDLSWTKLPVRFSRFREIEGALPRPKRLDEMIAVAEILGAGLDFIRVDLYGTDTRVYVGELTTTPGAGLADFEPREFNARLGEFW
jgi:TupA-like ATPgrasp